MKKIMLVISMMLLVLSIQAQVKFPENLEHYDGTKFLIDQEQIKGTHWSVINKTARNAIPDDKREVGMLVTWIESTLYVTKRFEAVNALDVNWTNDANWYGMISQIDTVVYADTAFFALISDTSNFALIADTANFALRADTANVADTALFALVADTSIFALIADTSNFTLTVSNITNWASYYNKNLPISIGDRVSYSGAAYSNLTASMSAIAPDIDVVNWAQIPLNTENGNADGQLLFWSGMSWMHTETDELFWDDSGKLYGIGTSTPNESLTIEAGVISVHETTTPIATSDYGKVYTKADNELYFQSGDGIEKVITNDYACTYITTPIETSVVTINTPLKIAGTTAEVTSSDYFTVSTSNRFTYTGANTRQMKITASLTFTANENNRLFTVYVAKNGTVAPSSAMQLQMVDGGKPLILTVTCMPSLSNGDYIEIWGENNSNTSNFTITHMNFNIITLN